jgi:hypothetical protein
MEDVTDFLSGVTVLLAFFSPTPFRKDFMILDSASKLNSNLPPKITTSLQPDVDYYMQLRKHICELMAFTRSYVAR